jgi:curved DNA-binding protein CbpA
MEPDYYKVLGVAPDAELAEIKASYRRAVRAHHPDAVPDGPAKEEAHERIQVINAAWTALASPSARLAYDDRRRRRAQAEALKQAEARARDRFGDGPESPTPSTGGTSTGPRGAAPEVSPQDEQRKKSRVAAVMGGTSPPRPSNPRTRLLAMVFDAAQLYHVEGKAEEAARVCQSVLRSDPTNAEAAVLLADIYAGQNRRDAALTLLERAMRLQPSNVLYRSKWEALRHAVGAASPSAAPAPPPSGSAGRASGLNPWAKAAGPPISSRAAQRAEYGDGPEAAPSAAGAPNAPSTAADAAAPPAESPAPPAAPVFDEQAAEPAAAGEAAESRSSLLGRWRGRLFKDRGNS